MRGWRAWYADGQVFASTRTAAQWLPRCGLALVIEYLAPPYRNIVQGGDWYVFDGERWWHTGTGPWGTWRPEPEGGVVIRSCSRLPVSDFERIRRYALAMPHLEP